MGCYIFLLCENLQNPAERCYTGYEPNKYYLRLIILRVHREEQGLTVNTFLAPSELLFHISLPRLCILARGYTALCFASLVVISKGFFHRCLPRLQSKMNDIPKPCCPEGRRRSWQTHFCQRPLVPA